MFRLAIFLATLVIANTSWAFSYTVEFTEQQLQQQISRLMPITKEHMLITVTLSDPVLELGGQNHNIGVTANMKIQAPGGIQGTGRTKIVGDISYKKENGSFYLYKPEIAHIEIDQIPAEFHANIRDLAQLALSNSISNKALFTLKDNNEQQRLAKSVLQSVTVTPGKLVIVLSLPENKQ
jgi:hypothetical protein